MTSHIDNTNPLFAGKSIPKIIIQLSWPAILEQFLICMANLGRYCMVGSIGPAATASVASISPPSGLSMASSQP